MRSAQLVSPSPSLPKLALCLLLVCTVGLSAEKNIPDAADQAETHVLFERVIANQKKVEEALDVYERLERIEMRRNSHDPKPYSEKSYRVIPAGTGTGRIPVRGDGQPADAAVYRAELLKLAHQLAWAAESGHAQSEAYAKIQKKRRERDELISAASQAFIFTFIAREPRGNRVLAKFRMEPNPAYKATSRNTSLYSKVRGLIWVDEAAGQLARIQGETTEDISIGMFLARVNKGSYFMQERYELFPGCWLPTFSQYDFDGRKLFMNFNIHERTFFTHYRHMGTPHEAFLAIQKEIHLAETAPAQSH
ncbi:MAG TPA: hypothetical protein VN982_05105 [Candidatus Dormibacteraeota bacterium]|nr:hypothetical protein [Candidatus Dormibacteraeota bacterium]